MQCLLRYTSTLLVALALVLSFGVCVEAFACDSCGDSCCVASTNTSPASHTGAVGKVSSSAIPGACPAAPSFIAADGGAVPRLLETSQSSSGRVPLRI